MNPPLQRYAVAGTSFRWRLVRSAKSRERPEPVFPQGRSPPSYRLKPLSEVASYIKTNGHLPDIPAAKEVEAKGVSLGEMQSKLLAKVEELTLHMIEADQENRELQERIARLEAEQRTAGGDAGSR